MLPHNCTFCGEGRGALLHSVELQQQAVQLRQVAAQWVHCTSWWVTALMFIRETEQGRDMKQHLSSTTSCFKWKWLFLIKCFYLLVSTQKHILKNFLAVLSFCCWKDVSRASLRLNMTSNLYTWSSPPVGWPRLLLSLDQGLLCAVPTDWNKEVK